MKVNSCDLLMNQEKSSPLTSKVFADQCYISKATPRDDDSRSTTTASSGDFSDCEVDDAQTSIWEVAPPGLGGAAQEVDAPPGLVQPQAAPLLSTPPGLAPAPAAPPAVARAPPGLEACRREGFDSVEFRKDVVATLRDLASDRNVGKAVRRVRAHQVPANQQALVVTDLLTRASEEFRGPARRACFAFVVGLAAGESSAFEREQFLEGVRLFFTDVYPDICEEAPHFSKIAAAELVPTLRPVLPAAQLRQVIPAELWREGPVATGAFVAPPKSNNKPTAVQSPQVFDPAAFQKDVVSTFRDLAVDRDVGKAVRRIRTHNVPKQRQAAEISNILTRSAEENRGPVRRVLFAFVCGLLAGAPSAFERQAFVDGVRSFFVEAYSDLCEENPRFPILASHELVPTLRSVLSPTELHALLPASLRGS